MLIKNGKVFLSDGKFHDCALRFGAQVEEIGAFDGEGCDASGCYVIPGLVDVHTHGAMNRDFSDGDPEALASPPNITPRTASRASWPRP